MPSGCGRSTTAARPPSRASNGSTRQPTGPARRWIPGRERLFGTAVYQRGALVVHALRRTVGDDAFFRVLRTWTTERRDGNATTDDLVALAERVSGTSLRSFFDTWLTGSSPPALP